MASLCAMREFEDEITCKNECECYTENGVCSEEYDIKFCAYQHRKEGAMNVPKSLDF